MVVVQMTTARAGTVSAGTVPVAHLFDPVVIHLVGSEQKQVGGFVAGRIPLPGDTAEAIRIIIRVRKVT